MFYVGTTFFPIVTCYIDISHSNVFYLDTIVFPIVTCAMSVQLFSHSDIIYIIFCVIWMEVVLCTLILDNHLKFGQNKLMMIVVVRILDEALYS